MVESQMTETHADVRIGPAREGSAAAATGLPVLDHLIGELAAAGRLGVKLEVAPSTAGAEAVAAGQALGRALATLLAADGAARRGWSIVPADEALAAASLEVTDKPLLAANVDFSDERVAGVSTDVASRFLEALAQSAGLNLHVRLLEGEDPQHVLVAIFKAVGAALGEAVRTPKDPQGG
jgi:imidazoleglycerol-phosphate dehydratase